MLFTVWLMYGGRVVAMIEQIIAIFLFVIKCEQRRYMLISKNDAKKLERSPTLNSILSLKKQSLNSLLGLSESEAKQFSKYELAYKITKKIHRQNLKDSLKAIVTCNS